MTDQQPTTITATEMQTKSGQIIRRAYDGEHFIVERHGYPMVVIVPVVDYRAHCLGDDSDEQITE